MPLSVGSILIGDMKRQRFLDDESRCDLIELARDGMAANRLSRRANALVLLDKGMSYAAVAQVLHMASAV